MVRSLWVLIAAAGKPELLQRTLSSLAAATKPASYRGALVVENGPRCGIEQIVRGFAPEHRFAHLYVREANKSHALNCGLQLLEFGLVFMTDDDVRLDENVLVAYDDAARGIDRGEFYGGPVLIDAEHGLPPQWMRKFYAFTIAESWSLPHSVRTAVPSQNFMGTNWAAFAEDLVAAGGFDSRFGPGGTTGATGQESEAQRALHKIHCQSIYVPQATAWHHLHKEFLDPRWVLKRAYRHGLEWGIRRTRDKRSTAPLMLHATLRRLNAHAKGLGLRILGGEEREFTAAYHEAKWRGRLDGMRMGQKWQEFPRMEVAKSMANHSRAA